MRALLLNFLLALTWAAVTGIFSARNLTIGFVLGFLILLFADRTTDHASYIGRIIKLGSFIGFFVWELMVANIRMAHSVITPSTTMRPGVIAIPLSAKTDAEITLLANLISLTPGTLSIDVSTDRKTLYIHAMFIDDVDTMRYEIKTGFERRLLEVLR
ncbi:Na+/H+ antiporter subunit E [soil metagenome]|jgi:multicomponent Na+:H+ antiporter subunit E